MRINVSPRKCYTEYETEKINDNQYKITAVYFMYSGNVLNDIYAKRIKTFNCDVAKLQRHKVLLHNNIVRTYSMLYAELKRIAAEVEVEKRMRSILR